MEQSFIHNVNVLAKNINDVSALAKNLTDENVVTLRKLLDEINLIPIIEDLEKGTFNGGRQIKVDLLKNYLAYEKNMTTEQLEDLYQDVANRPEYSAIVLDFTDGTSLNIPFIQDGLAYSISTNIELYEFLMNNSDITSKLQNTLFFATPALVSGVELVIADMDNSLSNLLEVQLISDDNKGLEGNPIYDWIEYTSALQLLAQYFSAIQFLAYNIEDILAVPDEVEATKQEILDITNDATLLVNRIILQISDPSLGNVGDVLTIEVVDGVKKAVYKSLVDASGGSFNIPPATSSTLGGIKVGSGLVIDLEGNLSADLSGGISSHNTDPNAHKETIMNVIPVATTVDRGTVTLRDTIRSVVSADTGVPTEKAVAQTLAPINDSVAVVNKSIENGKQLGATYIDMPSGTNILGSITAHNGVYYCTNWTEAPEVAGFVRVERVTGGYIRLTFYTFWGDNPPVYVRNYSPAAGTWTSWVKQDPILASPSVNDTDVSFNNLASDSPAINFTTPEGTVSVDNLSGALRIFDFITGEYKDVQMKSGNITCTTVAANTSVNTPALVLGGWTVTIG